MVSWDICISSSSGNCCSSHPEICSGDQLRLSFSATVLCNRRWTASRQGFGRHARTLACWSAAVARYPFRPPWRAISLLTVEGDLPIADAILRIEKPAARPREISSRSKKLRDRAERVRSLGVMPPLEATTPWIEPGCFPRALAMSLRDCPLFQRSQRSAFCEAESPGRPL